MQQQILRQEMDDIDENLASYEKQGGHVDGWILRGLEKRKENLDAKLHELQETIDAQKDDTVDFQQMGIDHLFVDESHYQNFYEFPIKSLNYLEIICFDL